jgi:hypothetical protein
MTGAWGGIISEPGACRDLSGYGLRCILLHFRTLRIYDGAEMVMLWAASSQPKQRICREISSSSSIGHGREIPTVIFGNRRHDSFEMYDPNRNGSD